MTFKKSVLSALALCCSIVILGNCRETAALRLSMNPNGKAPMGHRPILKLSEEHGRESNNNTRTEAGSSSEMNVSGQHQVPPGAPGNVSNYHSPPPLTRQGNLKKRGRNDSEEPGSPSPLRLSVPKAAKRTEQIAPRQDPLANMFASRVEVTTPEERVVAFANGDPNARLPTMQDVWRYRHGRGFNLQDMFNEWNLESSAQNNPARNNQ